MRRSLYIQLAIIVFAVAVLICSALMPRYLQAKSKDEQFKKGMIAIQLQLEVYIKQHGVAPENEEQLRQAYPGHFPMNPYSGREMVPRDLDSLRQYIGDFAYLPASVEEYRLDLPTSWKKSGYYLFGSGTDKRHENSYLRDEGYPGITVVLTSGEAYYGNPSTEGSLVWEDTEPLEAVLLRLKGYDVRPPTGGDVMQPSKAQPATGGA
jgi:hypothetical protein